MNQSAWAFSREFELLAACCRWPCATEIVREAATDLDWDIFLSLTKRHRVRALAAHGLRAAGVQLPTDQRERLTSAARDAAISSLRLADEAGRIDAALTAQGVRPIFIKGSTLALLAYGSLGLKEACDIDILIAPEEIRATFAALRTLAFVPFIGNEAVGFEQISTWSRFTKDTMWYDERSGTTIEVHTRLFSNTLLAADLAVDEAVSVTVTDRIRLHTLPLVELTLYLSVHGALHSWSRLKWLADFAALLAQLNADEEEQLLARARALGIERPLAHASILAQQVLGSAVGERLANELGRVTKVRELNKLALSAMTAGGARELDDRALSTLGIQVAHFFTVKGIRYKLAELRSKSVQPSDVLQPWPGSNFTALRLLASLPRWLARRVRLQKARNRN